MLGLLHISDVRRYIPRLIFQKKKVQAGQSSLPLFKLDWDSVDEYKKKEYRDWLTKPFPREKDLAEADPTRIDFSFVTVMDSWKERSSKAADIAIADTAPDTLPPEIDVKVKDLGFALTHDYRRAIEHYTRVFVEERTRQWKFDTSVRENCLTTSAAAINTAFYLLGDCMCHEESEGWYRGPYKRIYHHALRYKFWTLYTGRGLVWEKAALPELERHVEMARQHRLLHHKEADAGLPLFDETYTAFMERLNDWSKDQEKFWAFTAIEADGEEQDEDTVGEAREGVIPVDPENYM